MNVKKILFVICVALLGIGKGNAQKPNVLWIITDDHRADAIGAFNKAVTGKKDSPLGHVESPNIDKISEEGVLFTNGFCNSPGCAPSRASMHLGMYPWRSGVYGFEKTHVAASYYKGDVPTVMKSQGYNATYFGKGHIQLFRYEDGKINTKDVNHLYNYYAEMQDMRTFGYSDWMQRQGVYNGIKGKRETWFQPDGSKISYFLTVNSGEIPAEDAALRKEYEKKMHIIRKNSGEDADNSSDEESGGVYGGQSSMPGPLTCDGRITTEFQQYLENANGTYKAYNGKIVKGANTSQPQFINLGFHFPHTPVAPPKSFRDKFRKETYKIPEFSDEEREDLLKFKQLKSWYENARVDQMSYEERQDMIRDYYAFCAFGDSLVGEAVKTFKDYCKKNNQEYIIVMALGDHGWHLGEQGGETKFGPWDKSNHTTIIVTSSDKKRFPQNTVVRDFVEYVDFAPTFYATAGVDVSNNKFKHLDGYDLGEVVSGKKPSRDYVLGCMNQIFGERSYIRSKEFAFSMRTRPGWKKPMEADLMKNVMWPLNTNAQEVEMALYDLRVDPGEHKNVAYTQEYAQLADWFRKKLGNIVLGDRRIECDWSKENVWKESNFAAGSDDKKLDIPENIIPKVKTKK